MHSLVDQSRAALSTVLCLPLASHISSKITLPAPRLAASTTVQQRQIQYASAFSLAQVDKLLLVSCNTRGLETLLLSSFFDHDVPCNLVSPFLQGTFAALDDVYHDRCLLTHTLMERSPRLGFLWVGAMISGAHTHLRLARYGSMDVDPLSAAWTGTTQTFMQLPVSNGAQPGRISREDECQICYLALEEHQGMISMLPWKPFGTTSLKDAELDVQVHSKCKGHGLRYQNWTWDCWKDGRPGQIRHVPTSASTQVSDSPSPGYESAIRVPYEKLDLDDHSASAKATLCIFMWLRRDGYPAAELTIRKHEWIRDVLDEEDEANESWSEDEDDEDFKKKRAQSSKQDPRLGRWLTSTQPGRHTSIG